GPGTAGTMKRPLFCAFLVYLVIAGASVGGQAPQSPPSGPAAVPAPQAVINQYCVTCHNARALTGGLALDAVSPDKVEANAETWEKVIRKVRAGLMPPAGMPRPSRATLDAFAGAIENAVD